MQTANTDELITGAKRIWRPTQDGLSWLWPSVFHSIEKKLEARENCENEAILLYEMCYRLPFSMPENLLDDVIRLEERIRRAQPPAAADILLEIIIGICERHPEKATAAAIYGVVKCYSDTIHDRWSKKPDITHDKRRLHNTLCTVVARCPAGALAQAIKIDQTLFQEIAYDPSFPAAVTDRICEMQGWKTKEHWVYSAKSLGRAFEILQGQTEKLFRFGPTEQITCNIYDALDSIDLAFRLLPDLITPERIDILLTTEQKLRTRPKPHAGLINAISAVNLGMLERRPQHTTAKSLQYLSEHYTADPNNSDKPDNFFLADPDRLENTLVTAIIYAQPHSIEDAFQRESRKIKERTAQGHIRPRRQNEMVLRFAVINMFVAAHFDLVLKSGHPIEGTLASDAELAEIFYRLDSASTDKMEVDLDRLSDVFSKLAPAQGKPRQRTFLSAISHGPHRFRARTSL